jgi:hypothetical protein
MRHARFAVRQTTLAEVRTESLAYEFERVRSARGRYAMPSFWLGAAIGREDVMEALHFADHAWLACAWRSRGAAALWVPCDDIRAGLLSILERLSSASRGPETGRRGRPRPQLFE